MAQVVPMFTYKASAPWAMTALATDAVGASRLDHGGYEVVARTISRKLLENLLDVGMAPGRTVARLDGDLSGFRRPDRELRATVPFTRLDQEWFAEDAWLDVASGRWLTSDHITLGEARRPAV